MDTAKWEDYKSKLGNDPFVIWSYQQFVVVVAVVVVAVVVVVELKDTIIIVLWSLLSL